MDLYTLLGCNEPQQNEAPIPIEAHMKCAPVIKRSGSSAAADDCRLAIHGRLRVCRLLVFSTNDDVCNVDDAYTMVHVQLMVYVQLMKHVY